MPDESNYTPTPKAEDLVINHRIDREYSTRINNSFDALAIMKLAREGDFSEDKSLNQITLELNLQDSESISFVNDYYGPMRDFSEVRSHVIEVMERRTYILQRQESNWAPRVVEKTNEPQVQEA